MYTTAMGSTGMGGTPVWKKRPAKQAVPRQMPLFKKTGFSDIYQPELRAYFNWKKEQQRASGQDTPSLLRAKVREHISRAVTAENKTDVAARLYIASHMMLVVATKTASPRIRASDLEFASLAIGILVDYVKQAGNEEEAIRAVLDNVVKTDAGASIMVRRGAASLTELEALQANISFQARMLEMKISLLDMMALVETEKLPGYESTTTTIRKWTATLPLLDGGMDTGALKKISAEMQRPNSLF